MNKARIIFIVLTIYIFAAFGWWTYAHYKNAKLISLQQKDVLEMRCYKATFDIQGGIDQQLFDDTIGLRTFFDPNYPDLEVVFLNNFIPLSNYMVRPKLDSYKSLENNYKRQLWMYIMEGIVMMLLLFWGVIVIYSSFKKELLFKRLQANFLLSITHELKTPLTAMKLYMETLLKRQVSPEQTKTIIENSLIETDRLQEQVEKLLLSAQLDNHKYQLQKQSLNLSELLEEIIANFIRPRNHSLTIETNIQEQVIVQGDANALEMIINNLISNAIKYGGETSTIKISLVQTNQFTSLKIADEGPGIKEEEKKLLFNKFFRTGDENTRKTKGTGLGLFIVKNLVDLHQGKITISNNEPKGTIFEIKLNSDAN
ncbi:MAG: HAMP domain-containing histidine kinase [Bacteroidia bacterium]|nr:HAMP domain-containing histidine kinase [Bacteroidia bacterium]MCF8426242.1 HAMP domain-containing histidine kinase [Bacteroidia bacterium]MCF8445447.1 HAMP domain-containing histidine kinase [Bacteroidia bacterium]